MKFYLIPSIDIQSNTALSLNVPLQSRFTTVLTSLNCGCLYDITIFGFSLLEKKSSKTTKKLYSCQVQHPFQMHGPYSKTRKLTNPLVQTHASHKLVPYNPDQQTEMQRNMNLALQEAQLATEMKVLLVFYIQYTQTKHSLPQLFLEVSNILHVSLPMCGQHLHVSTAMHFSYQQLCKVFLLGQ